MLTQINLEVIRSIFPLVLAMLLVSTLVAYAATKMTSMAVKGVTVEPVKVLALAAVMVAVTGLFTVNPPDGNVLAYAPALAIIATIAIQLVGLGAALLVRNRQMGQTA